MPQRAVGYAGTSLCLGRAVCRGWGSRARGFPTRSCACGLHSHHPCCSASERCRCLLITLIIENYRFSVGNVYLHPTFPKLPISIAVMSYPPARFRQRWALLPAGRAGSTGHTWGRAVGTWHSAGPCPACATKPSGLVRRCRQHLRSIPEPGPCTHCPLLGKCPLAAQEMRGQ